MTTINQKEYLKKYLGIGKGSGVKKKKTKSGRVLGKSLKIIDDDVDAAAALSKEIQDDLANHNEDAPQIVAVIDDRPPSLRIDETTKDNLWKPIGQVADSDLLSTHPGIKKDLSPSRKTKQSDYDYSPSRKSSKNQSPSRKSKSKWDVSPPMGVHEDIATRIKVEQDDISSPWKSPSRRTQRNIDIIPSHDSKEDISPPRNSKCNVSSGQNSRDMSPQRKVGRNKDYSPQRKSRNPNIEISSQNSRYISPPRKVERNDSPRKSRKANSSSYSRKNEETRVSRWNRNSPRTENNDNTIQAEKIEKTLSGKKSGLQNAKDLVQEIITLRQNEELLFKNMSHEVSGRNAITISRKKKTTTAEEDAKEIENKKEMEVKYSKWGKGIKQVQDTLGKNEDMLHEMSKPLARYADDEDLEQYLKKQERDGDPMLAYIRKKKKKKQVEAGIPEKPMYLGDFEPNRFGIKPGYRWDGVDRSNGYEKKLFESKNSKEAAEEDAMKWNTEDM